MDVYVRENPEQHSSFTHLSRREESRRLLLHKGVETDVVVVLDLLEHILCKKKMHRPNQRPNCRNTVFKNFDNTTKYVCIFLLTLRHVVFNVSDY